MKRTLLSLLALAALFAWNDAPAHPGSGIVADREGNIYIIDTGAGVWKINRTGTLTRLQAPAYHWLAIDLDGRLTNVTLPYYASEDATVTRVGTRPTLLVSSDFPLTVGRDGSLYYVWGGSGKEVQIVRLAPSGESTVFKSLPLVRDKRGELRWRNGITAAPDGSIYYTEDRAVRRVTQQGELITIVSDIRVPDCTEIPGVEAELGPYCRGLDVDSAGTVFVAATGCGAVLKITKDGKVTTVLRAASPWSPTAVLVLGSDLYVLEYLHTQHENRREWVPRVRKVSSDGRVATIATIERR